MCGAQPERLLLHRAQGRMERHVRTSVCWPQRQIAAGLVVIMAVLLAAPALAQTAQPAAGQQGGTSSAAKAQTAHQATGQPAAETNRPTQDVPQTTPEPVGTAVAPYEKTVGVASSRPAGAVIAPAKQRRAHSLLIKVGLIAAGAVAIGTVVALSKSSSGRPN
jgi:hypothetical protein